MKMCLIGCGAIVRSCHGPAYVLYRKESPDFITAACCDTDKSRAGEIADLFSFSRSYDDFNVMLDYEKPDCVCVCVTEAHSYEVGMAVIERGIPLLIEKPPGKNAAETARLAEAAAKNGVQNMVAFNRRFMPLMTRARQWIVSLNEEIEYIRYDFTRHGRDDADFSDTAVHAIDAVRYLTGSDYSEIRFTYQDYPGRRAANVAMEAVMNCGAAAHIHVNPHAGATLERASIHTGSSTLLLNLPIWGVGYDMPGKLTLIKNVKVEQEITGNDVRIGDELCVTNGFFEENKVFFDAVRTGDPISSTLDSALQTMKVKEYYSERLNTYFSR